MTQRRPSRKDRDRTKQELTDPRPSVFVGSSSEGLQIAEALQQNLDRACEVVIWSQGLFGLSGGTLETLVKKATEFDFAVLVLTPDDMIVSRRKARPTARDNVLIEIGLFIGTIGRERTFCVFDRSEQIKIPTDLAGVTLATFQPHRSGNLQSSVGAASTQIQTAISSLGLRKPPGMTFDINESTQFQIMASLLDTVPKQFIILMSEKGTTLQRERSQFAGGIGYLFGVATQGGRDKTAGQGNFSVNDFLKKLPDAGLLQQDLRDNVSLTERGQKFAKWLLERGHKVGYFQSDVGGWGNDADNPNLGPWPPNLRPADLFDPRPK